MRVLLATDGSPNADTCVSTLSNRSLADDSLIHVISIYDPIQSKLFPKRLTQERADGLVAQAVEQITLGHPKGQVTGAVLRGHPVTRILETAESFRPDVMFLGAHARASWRDEVLGSTTDEVLRRSACSVVVVRSESAELVKTSSKHLLCFDNSEVTARAFLELEKRFWPPDSEFVILHVLVDLFEPGSNNPENDAEISAKRMADRMGSMKMTVDEQVESLAKSLPDHKVSGLVVPEEFGGAVDTIITTAKEIDANLIVMGSHQRKGVDRFWLGSVSEAVAEHAHCSVEIIRPMK
ncbi:MAG: universal stress protein [Candidatus Obscuribacterales bacterium]